MSATHTHPTASPNPDPSAAAAMAAGGGLIATVVTAAACGGPLLAISLGIGGFGWLARYATLRVPATLVTLALLAWGFRVAYARRGKACAAKSRRLAWARGGLWVAAALALAANAFEYVLFPLLG